MDVARATMGRSTCPRRKVGCVLLNERGHILATGYNGVAAGLPHCGEGSPCKGAKDPAQRGECTALHAEANALLQCHNVHEIEEVYVTTSPCVECTKLLLNTSARRICFNEPHKTEDAAKALWLSREGNTWEYRK